MPEYKARIVYSGEGKPKISDSVGDDVEREIYVSMPPVSTWKARIRIMNVLYASPIIVSP